MKPSAIARSGVTTPMPTVRCFQIRFSVSSVSYSSTHAGEALGEVGDEVEQAALPVLVHPRDRPRIVDRARPGIAASSPAGRGRRRPAGNRRRASARPTPPRSTSIRSSRSRNAYRNVVIAPTSSECAPSHSRWLRMRVISSNITRMYCARTRHVDAGELLDRQAVRVLVAHHRHVVEPVHVRQRLDVRPRLGQLLGRAVQEPDVRVGALDHLAVELEHEPQHAVRRRVLRAKIHRVIADLGHRTRLTRCPRSVCSRMTRGVISRGSIVTGW